MKWSNETLQCFWDLTEDPSSLNESLIHILSVFQRGDAAATPPETQKYVLARLIRGLASPRLFARQGFCVVLVNLLRQVHIPTDTLIEISSNCLSVTKLGKKESDSVHVGRVLFLWALKVSGYSVDDFPSYFEGFEGNKRFEVLLGKLHTTDFWESLGKYPFGDRTDLTHRKNSSDQHNIVDQAKRIVDHALSASFAEQISPDTAQSQWDALLTEITGDGRIMAKWREFAYLLLGEVLQGDHSLWSIFFCPATWSMIIDDWSVPSSPRVVLPAQLIFRMVNLGGCNPDGAVVLIQSLLPACASLRVAFKLAEKIFASLPHDRRRSVLEVILSGDLPPCDVLSLHDLLMRDPLCPITTRCSALCHLFVVVHFGQTGGLFKVADLLRLVESVASSCDHDEMVSWMSGGNSQWDDANEATPLMVYQRILAEIIATYNLQIRSGIHSSFIEKSGESRLIILQWLEGWQAGVEVMSYGKDQTRSSSPETHLVKQTLLSLFMVTATSGERLLNVMGDFIRGVRLGTMGEEVLVVFGMRHLAEVWWAVKRVVALVGTLFSPDCVEYLLAGEDSPLRLVGAILKEYPRCWSEPVLYSLCRQVTAGKDMAVGILNGCDPVENGEGVSRSARALLGALRHRRVPAGVLTKILAKCSTNIDDLLSREIRHYLKCDPSPQSEVLGTIINRNADKLWESAALLFDVVQNTPKLSVKIQALTFLGCFLCKDLELSDFNAKLLDICKSELLKLLSWKRTSRESSMVEHLLWIVHKLSTISVVPGEVADAVESTLSRVKSYRLFRMKNSVWHRCRAMLRRLEWV